MQAHHQSYQAIFEEDAPCRRIVPMPAQRRVTLFRRRGAGSQPATASQAVFRSRCAELKYLSHREYRGSSNLNRRIALPSLFAAVLLAQASALGQPIQIAALTNSADFQPSLPQPGSLASIFCTGLQGPPGVIAAPPQYPLPAQLVVAGSPVTVWISFIQAPILAIAFENGYQQINVQVPWQVPQDPLFVQVFQGSNQGSNSAYLVDPDPWVDFLAGSPATFKWSVFFVSPQGLRPRSARIGLFGGHGAESGPCRRVPGRLRNQSGAGRQPSCQRIPRALRPALR